jgi:TolA-binding protein
MTMKMRSSSAVLAAAIAVGSTMLSAQQASNEELPRRQFESGMSFMQGGRYTEALKDFQAVIDSFPRSQVADNALLQTALYYLDVAHDPSATQQAIDKLVREYPESDSAPMAYVVAGRLSMAKGRAAADVDAALASFERVPRLFPGNDAVPAAGFYAGETLRLVRRTDEALDRFRRVTAEYPSSSWAAMANLAAGYCLVLGDRAAAALPEVQRVRQQLPNSPAAADALNINTILYRLYVRAPGQPAYGFNGRFVGEEKPELKDVVGVIVDPAGRILIAHKIGVTIFDAKGAPKGIVPANDPSSFFVDERGRIVVARNDTLIAEKAESTAITLTQPDGKIRLVEEIPSVVALSNGNRLIADRKAKNILRVSATGKDPKVFLDLNAERLALNRLDDVAVIEKETKGVTIADRDGKVITKIPARGAGYQFDEPVDLTFDQLGHLYVLDRGKASVYVFSPKYKLITTFTIPEKSAGAFSKARSLALDASGRMYIFDERAKRIQVYQ